MDCPDGFYNDFDLNECVACKYGCLSCPNRDMCDKCDKSKGFN